MRTIPDRGWAGRTNGEILALAEGSFDAFLTADQALPTRQNLRSLDRSVIVLASVGNRLRELLPLMPEVVVALQRLEPGQWIRIES